MLPLGDNRFLIGPLEYDRSRGTIRFRSDSMGQVARELVANRHFLGRWAKEELVLESHPVPGHPDRVWVVRAIRPLASSGSKQEVRVTVWQISPKGFMFKKDFSHPHVSRHRLAAVSPEGNLILRQHQITRITADFKVKDETAWDFCELWPVVFLEEKKVRRVEWVKSCNLRALPDGRWAALIPRPNASQLDAFNLLVGTPEQWDVLGVGEVGFEFRRLMGAYPLPNGEWAVVLDGGVLFLDSLRVVDHLKIGTIPEFVFPGALMMSGSGEIFVVPDREVPVSEVPRWKLAFEGAMASESLGCLSMHQGSANRRFVLLLPSREIVCFENASFGSIQLDVGEDGFLLAENLSAENLPSNAIVPRAILHFLDPSGRRIKSLEIKGKKSDDVIVIPLRWRLFLVAVRKQKGRDGRWADFCLRVFDPSGEQIDEIELHMPSLVRLEARAVKKGNPAMFLLRFDSPYRGGADHCSRLLLVAIAEDRIVMFAYVV